MTEKPEFKVLDPQEPINQATLYIDLRDDGTYVIKQGDVVLLVEPEFEEDGRKWAYETIYRMSNCYLKTQS